MKLYKTGDKCPCCGSPILLTDPEALRLFSLFVALTVGPEVFEDAKDET